MKIDLRKLYQYTEWANQSVLTLLRSDERAWGMPTARYFAHLVAAERIWLLRLQGRESGAQEIWPELSLDEAAAMAEENALGYARLLDDPARTAEIEYRNSRGTLFRTRVDDILLHVGLHGAYHRGQIATAVRAAGGEPIITDYIAWVRSIASDSGGPSDLAGHDRGLDDPDTPEHRIPADGTVDPG